MKVTYNECFAATGIDSSRRSQWILFYEACIRNQLPPLTFREWAVNGCPSFNDYHSQATRDW